MGCSFAVATGTRQPVPVTSGNRAGGWPGDCRVVTIRRTWLIEPGAVPGCGFLVRSPRSGGAFQGTFRRHLRVDQGAVPERLPRSFRGRSCRLVPTSAAVQAAVVPGSAFQSGASGRCLFRRVDLRPGRVGRRQPGRSASRRRWGGGARLASVDHCRSTDARRRVAGRPGRRRESGGTSPLRASPVASSLRPFAPQNPERERR